MARITVSVPCCDGCVLEASQRAGFDYSKAFFVVSGLEELGPAEMTNFVGSLVSATKSKVFLYVESPLATLAAPDTAEEAVEGETAPEDGDGESNCN